MKLSELIESVNKKVFMQGFEQEREILGGKYKLVAKHGYLPYTTPQTRESKQFRIEAKTAKGALIGWVNFEIINDNHEALDLSVNEKHRQKGIATEMYKFARDLGNTIKPSSKQTAMGKKFWNKDHSQ